MVKRDILVFPVTYCELFIEFVKFQIIDYTYHFLTIIEMTFGI